MGGDRRHPARACCAKLLEDRKITLELTDGAAPGSADVGYDPVYGARPLKRVIQKYLQDPLAEKLLAGEILDGAAVPCDGRRRRRSWSAAAAAAGAGGGALRRAAPAAGARHRRRASGGGMMMPSTTWMMPFEAMSRAAPR